MPQRYEIVFEADGVVGQGTASNLPGEDLVVDNTEHKEQDA